MAHLIIASPCLKTNDILLRPIPLNCLDFVRTIWLPCFFRGILSSCHADKPTRSERNNPGSLLDKKNTPQDDKSIQEIFC